MIRMPNDTVHLEVADGVATVTLDRPRQLNAMTPALMDDVTAAVAHVENDSSARVLVLTGAGRGFCSGADLTDSAVAGGGEGEAGGPQSRDDIGAAIGAGATATMNRSYHPTILALNQCRVPTIARINGVAAGAGMGLAMAADISIATQSAFFVATFGPRLGIVPDLGTTWHLPRRVGRARALGIAMLGDRFTADEAAEWGLISRAVPDDQFDDEIARAANILRRSSTEAMLRIRGSIDVASDNTLSQQLDVERDHQGVLIPMNMIEGALAFIERRDPDFSTDPA